MTNKGEIFNKKYFSENEYMKEENKKDLTIYDIAKELNVSGSTVSRALNDHPGIGKKTRKAIKDLASEWNYRPNLLAASLRTKRSNTIGVLVPWINRPFISSLISGIESSAFEAGYNVIISQSHDSYEMEKQSVQALSESRISALIVSLAMQSNNYKHFDIFNNNGIPIVYVDRIPQLKNIYKVHIDNFNAAFEATEHLINQGCKRIAHFGGTSDQIIYEERRLGYISALKQYGLNINDELNLKGKSLSADESIHLCESVFGLDNPPDGLFCANDTSTVSAIQFAKNLGIRIPEDLAVIGFNNDPICTIINPTLSSVEHPAIEMGKLAFNQALRLLPDNSSTNDASMNSMPDTHLVVRQSSNRAGLNGG